MKKAGRDSEAEERSGFSDEEESDRNSHGQRTAEEKLKRSLFGDDEGNDLSVNFYLFILVCMCHFGF